MQTKIEISLESSLKICRNISHVNQDVVERCCSDGHLMSLKLNDKLIGFATWDVITPYRIRIQLVEIDKSYRKRKFGSKLIVHLLEYFIKNGCLVVDLQCAPLESEKFWKSQGFKEFPPDARCEKTKQLYKILVPTLKETNNPKLNRIELVNDYGKINDNWIWNLEFIKGTKKLIKPIIFPCNDEWRLRCFENGVISVDRIVKHISVQDNSGYIIIHELASVEETYRPVPNSFLE